MATRNKFLDTNQPDTFDTTASALPFDSPIGDTNPNDAQGGAAQTPPVFVPPPGGDTGAGNPPPTFDPNSLTLPGGTGGTQTGVPAGVGTQGVGVTDPRATATPTAPTHYNTTPNWRDPFNPPSPGDPYWNEWIAANPGYQIPTGGHYPNTTINPTTGQSTTNPTHEYLATLVNGGIDPAEAIARWNRETGRTHGNEAVLYPAGSHGPGSGATIGLPDGYLAQNADGTWGWVPRTEGGTGGAPPPNPAGPGSSASGPGLSSAINDLIGAFRTTGPQTAVGTDPFSQNITGGINDLITHGGMTPEMGSVYGTLADLIRSGGKLPNDASIDQAALEKAREDESRAFTGQLADTRAELASRGLVSEPGIGQGEEGGAINRITQGLAPQYASAVRDISTASADRQNQRVMSALSTITGLSESASQNLLASLGEGTQRQSALAQIALDSLSQNMQWNEFLANYGLSRDNLMYQIQQGNIGSILPVLALFSQFVGHTQQGFF